jgi:hypothetical protein
MNSLTTKESHEHYKKAWVRTRYGSFDLDAPVFDILDISHALSNNCRFNGHTRSFYSVAEHSLMVCGLMQMKFGGNPLEGLLHDGTEAYLSDIPAPFKSRLPDVRAFDAGLERELRKAFYLPESKTEECSKADWVALFIEAHDLIEGRGEDFQDPYNLRAVALELVNEGWHPRSLEPPVANNLFLQTFRHYRPVLGDSIRAAILETSEIVRAESGK